MYTDYPEIEDSSYEELDAMIGFEDYMNEVENTLMGAELIPEDLERTLDALDAYLDEKYDIYDIIDTSPVGTVVRLRATFMETLDFVITGTVVESSDTENEGKVLSIDNVEED